MAVPRLHVGLPLSQIETTTPSARWESAIKPTDTAARNAPPPRPVPSLTCVEPSPPAWIWRTRTRSLDLRQVGLGRPLHDGGHVPRSGDGVGVAVLAARATGRVEIRLNRPAPSSTPIEEPQARSTLQRRPSSIRTPRIGVQAPSPTVSMQVKGGLRTPCGPTSTVARAKGSDQRTGPVAASWAWTSNASGSKPSGAHWIMSSCSGSAGSASDSTSRAYP